MNVFDQLAIATLPLIPTPIMRRLAGRYIAGEALDEAIECLRALQRRGYPGVIDLLGEDVRDEAEARQVVVDYLAAAAAVEAQGLDAYVSVKPTHVGLELSEELAFELYAELAADCARRGQMLRVEMEDHTTTDRTLAVFARLCERFDNVGIVLQARLFRTFDDIAALPAKPLNVRLVKGIYLEPAAIAHEEPEPIREAFVECAKQLLDRGDFVAFATHDDLLAERVLEQVRGRALPTDRYEFQVLLGVRGPLWKTWREAGHTVRVYVPYGPQWRPYSLRRLKKNPQIFRHVVKDTLSFGR
ncbi:MAG: proline dehydrogenase family protein [Planctomycetota bacterium]